MRCTNWVKSAAALAVASTCCAPALAQPIFSDSFDNDASLLWGNERGNWSASLGRYSASIPSNNPCTFSSLPFDLADMTFECDILGADDGGIWLHANSTGTSGVLFVLARGQAYWHTITNDIFSSPLNPATGVYSTGQNVHVRIEVVGGTYSAFINNSPTPVTTLTDGSFPSGLTGVYDFSGSLHAFDNVVVEGQCVTGDCCTYVSRDPLPVTICPFGVVNVHAEGAGSNLEFAWDYETAPGEWQAIIDGPNFAGDTFLFNAAGAQTQDLTLDRGTLPWTTSYSVRMLVANPCDNVETQPALISVCPADFDCSGFADTDDFTAFVLAFEAGTDNADFDGTGFVDTDDFTAFVLAFEAGC
ncbi:MAG TPA: GC-type dockerin domain-anchored protein [Phycisphaerales bacterium]|nr:GC-type dockerin domain-anchored protein [Phycisphaerales bacterium]